MAQQRFDENSIQNNDVWPQERDIISFTGLGDFLLISKHSHFRLTSDIREKIRLSIECKLNSISIMDNVSGEGGYVSNFNTNYELVIDYEQKTMKTENRGTAVGNSRHGASYKY